MLESNYSVSCKKQKNGKMKMKKELKKSKGITLIALVITIIILLILAGISISALTQTGLFGRAKQAEQVSKEKQEEENATLGTYEDEIDKYLGDKSGAGEKLLDKVNDGTIKIGDYVKYTPDTVNSTSYNNLISDFGTYSGSTANTTSTLTQETTLNWRVLDVTDDGQVRLISDKPTTRTIELQGYNGYNNAVKLLDDACSILYTNKQLANKVQNVKIEDITKHITTQPAEGKIVDTLKDIKYPKILEQEENQTVEKSTTENKLGLSSQSAFVTGSDTSKTSTLKNTFWGKNMQTSDLEEGYYELFINNGSNYPTYWMSSRCVNADSGDADFYVRYVGSGDVYAYYLYYSDDTEDSIGFAFRPIITLNSNVQIDTANSGDGRTAAQGYAINN